MATITIREGRLFVDAADWEEATNLLGHAWLAELEERKFTCPAAKEPALALLRGIRGATVVPNCDEVSCTLQDLAHDRLSRSIDFDGGMFVATYAPMHESIGTQLRRMDARRPNSRDALWLLPNDEDGRRDVRELRDRLLFVLSDAAETALQEPATA